VKRQSKLFTLPNVFNRRFLGVTVVTRANRTLTESKFCQAFFLVMARDDRFRLSSGIAGRNSLRRPEQLHPRRRGTRGVNDRDLSQRQDVFPVISVAAELPSCPMEAKGSRGDSGLAGPAK
jgi:hypothetical protein